MLGQDTLVFAHSTIGCKIAALLVLSAQAALDDGVSLWIAFASANSPIIAEIPLVFNIEGNRFVIALGSFGWVFVWC